MERNDATPMEIDGESRIELPSETSGGPDKNETEVSLQLSIDWSGSSEASKYKTLQKILQRWANKNKFDINFNVVSASEDKADIIIWPAKALRCLDKLHGQTLTSKEGDVKVTVKQPKLKPSSFSLDEQQEEKRSEERNQFSSLAAETEFKAEEEMCNCSVPVGLFWYVNQIYREEIKRIETKNGVQIEPEVTVNFKPNQLNADVRKAHSEFTSLVQKSLTESSGFIVPFQTMAPQDCSTILDIIQKYDNKLLLSISSKEITVCGPQSSQNAVKECLDRNQIATINAKPSVASTDEQLTIEMKINDPLVKTGLSIETSQWGLMKNSFKEQLNEIQTRFNVDLSETNPIQGKVDVRACYRTRFGNVAMESHALRALLRLYQKMVTSHKGSTLSHEVSGLNSWTQQNSDPQSEGAVGGQPNGKPGYSHQDNINQSTKESENDKDDNCPICLDKFTNKKRLKCKHEFCEECLERAKATTGPICPLCKHVFGVVEGDQPDGRMTWRKESSSLPGFPGCRIIVINYNIPSGKQTKKHPNPGRAYTGVSRTAYLPDNKEGNEVLGLLKKAFDQKLIFTVGTSRTTGMENQVTWNDIHHKTSKSGGPQCFGYPDPLYLSRVREELKAKGIQ